MEKYSINEENWQRFSPFIKPKRVKNKVKTRLFLEGIYFILKTGSQWRELPYFYGK